MQDIETEPQGIVPCIAVVADGAESEVCEYCEGLGSISYNPNLNPNAFPATTSAECRHCGGTGIVEDDASRSATIVTQPHKCGNTGD